MFPYNDPYTVLDLQHRHAAELRHEAVAHRLARSASAGGRHRNSRWWSRLAHRGEAARAPVTP